MANELLALRVARRAKNFVRFAAAAAISQRKPMHDDRTLLRQFVDERSQRAFAELVDRHLHLVYFAALRQTNGATQLAQDAAQQAFVRLAGKAAELLAHPEITGWLHTTACHCARELTRSEQRRQQREHVAHEMDEVTHASAHDEAWLRVRPLIDDALLELAEEDRAAVLLRYFESQPFAAIATTLQLSENAARMRVERAMDRLHAALAKRGVTSSAAALAGALSVPAALAVPAGLGPQIASAALSTAVVSATSVGLLHFMASAKTLATVTSVAALLAIGTAVYQQRELSSVRAESAELQRQQAELQSRIGQLEARPIAPPALAAPGSGSMATSSKIGSSVPAAAPVAPADEPITQAVVEARYKKAQELADSGKFTEALTEFMWCFDTGMPRITGYSGVRRSFLLSAIAKLGKDFPPALAALQERRDAAEKRVVADASDRDAMMDYSNLNRVLGENDRSLVIFDSLPAGDPRRALLAYDLTDQLLEAKRYKDLTDARPYSSMRRLFDTTSDFSRFKDRPAQQLDSLRQSIVKTNARNVEALAGAGDLADARDFIGKLLALDSSFETRALIQRHLERAGHPELLPPTP